MAQFLLPPFSVSPCSPCCFFLLPFVPLSTYLAPSSCDRNRPPPSQVACKLTLFAPPFTQLSHPSQLPRTPSAQRLTTTTLGPFRSCYAEHKCSSLWHLIYTQYTVCTYNGMSCNLINSALAPTTQSFPMVNRDTLPESQNLPGSVR